MPYFKLMRAAAAFFHGALRGGLGRDADVNHAQSRSAATRRSAASPDNRGVYRLALDQTAIRRLVAAGGHRRLSLCDRRRVGLDRGVAFGSLSGTPLHSAAAGAAVFAAECRARSIPGRATLAPLLWVSVAPRCSQPKDGVSEAYTTTVGHAADTAAASGPVPVNSRFR